MRRYTSFHYRAKSWSKARRVVAKVAFHSGELFSRVGFIVANRSQPNERVLALPNDRGAAEQHTKEGKYALKWTRLSCMRFAANAIRHLLHALAYNLANFPRTLARPEAIEAWLLTSLRERLPPGWPERFCLFRNLPFPDVLCTGAWWLSVCAVVTQPARSESSSSFRIIWRHFPTICVFIPSISGSCYAARGEREGGRRQWPIVGCAALMAFLSC